MFEPIVYGNRIGLGVNMMRASRSVIRSKPFLNAFKKLEKKSMEVIIKDLI